MTRLAFLSPVEKRKFDSPPVSTKEQRRAYFAVTEDIRRTLSQLRTTTNKVGFLLQLGYFRYSGKFFAPSFYRRRDILYVKNLLNTKDEFHVERYPSARILQHRSRILALLGWEPFNSANTTLVAEHTELLAQQQLKPNQIFVATVNFCWKRNIEIPTYHQLSTVITDSFNIVESSLLKVLASSLGNDEKSSLDALITQSKTHWLTLLGQIKQVDQSLRSKDIQKNVDAAQTLRSYFSQFQSILNTLDLNQHATQYYATWVEKATLTQIKQISNPQKRYLLLLAFIQHQHYSRQDVLMDVFLKSVRTATNASNKKLAHSETKLQSERKAAIQAVNASHKSSRYLLGEITRIVRSKDESDAKKMGIITQLIDDYESLQNETKNERLSFYEQVLDRHVDGQQYYDTLERESIRLQRKIAAVLKLFEFDVVSSDVSLIAAVNHFKNTDGNLGTSPPMAFLPENVREIVSGSDGFRTSLYKILLFQSVADGVRAGQLNLMHSYRYRAISDYLISKSRWQQERDRLLALAGLQKFADGEAYIEELKTTLEEAYQNSNERFVQGDNPLLSIDSSGSPRVSTPATAYSQDGYNGLLLKENGIVPLLGVLRDIDKTSNFTRCFKHLSPKYHKLKPTAETVLAGVIGMGCNIGIDKLSHISQGINSSTLKNTVTWCFSLNNIQAANSAIIALTDKLALPNAFQHSPGELHTSSDGRKVNVAVDSLLASYSFKYFGKDKGVAMYTFIDERHALFHSTVISASDREAAYVIDGLMQNDVIKSDIHSTDTHGFSEAIFAATHMIDTAFAPRFKKIGDQRLYGFSNKATYQRRGYSIVPSRTINRKLILNNWEDILRFMATIKLRYASASQLFKRLSSYAKDHPLYRALKEFGRIIKSQFILTYLDDVELRQRIEKQLNKVELANKFSAAVFFANNQEFQTGTKEGQEVATACMVLIQNAIVLWNYLYLSQRLSSAKDPDDRREMLEAITNGSMLAWAHVNMQGEYDFRRRASNDDFFDMPSILALELG